MQRHFVEELESLKTSLVKMGSLVETVVSDSIRSFVERKKDLAKAVIAQDERINSLEIEIDNAVVDLLALQQPVASDLRFILAALKINNDLERIGDHAVNIAESALQFTDTAPVEALVDIRTMAETTKAMLRDALDGFIHGNPALSRKVLQSDDVIDDLNRKIIKDLVDVIRKNAAVIGEGLEMIRVSRNLERIADLTTNIAEDVIFAAEAQIVKHHLEEKKQTG